MDRSTAAEEKGNSWLASLRVNVVVGVLGCLMVFVRTGDLGMADRRRRGRFGLAFTCSHRHRENDGRPVDQADGGGKGHAIAFARGLSYFVVPIRLHT